MKFLRVAIFILCCVSVEFKVYLVCFCVYMLYTLRNVFKSHETGNKSFMYFVKVSSFVTSALSGLFGCV